MQGGKRSNLYHRVFFSEELSACLASGEAEAIIFKYYLFHLLLDL